MTAPLFSTGQLVVLVAILGCYLMAWIGRR
jgi:hypothetical protein